jgi:mannose-6-phosphate isomerase-like protein (cupin superfamily)
MPRVAAALLGTILCTAAALTAQEATAPPGGGTSPAAADAAPTPIVPVHHEPHHRQVFQYGPMRILDLQIPPNDMSWFHLHEWPVLYMTLGTSQTRTQNLGGEWGGRGRGAAPGGARPGGAAPRAGGAAPRAGGAAPRAGGAPAGPGRAGGSGSPRATSTTSYIDQPVTHRLENIGTNLFRAMVVVNETHGDETTSQQDAGFDGTPELTNKWFRAYRLTLKPGEATASHRHRAPVVIFQATPGTGLGAGAMKFEFNEPGQWAFFDAGDAHEVRNTGEAPLELIEVEVRRK